MKKIHFEKVQNCRKTVFKRIIIWKVRFLKFKRYTYCCKIHRKSFHVPYFKMLSKVLKHVIVPIATKPFKAELRKHRVGSIGISIAFIIICWLVHNFYQCYDVIFNSFLLRCVHHLHHLSSCLHHVGPPKIQKLSSDLPFVADAASIFCEDGDMLRFDKISIMIIIIIKLNQTLRF